MIILRSLLTVYSLAVVGVLATLGLAYGATAIADALFHIMRLAGNLA